MMGPCPPSTLKSVANFHPANKYHPLALFELFELNGQLLPDLPQPFQK
jgi:hypothetical protein